ncbi:site-specific recombinase XerD [Parabacteroides sp. PF5-5]|uniref:tyrosine-type recombinase/integrase n=1 Tax=unclassified Parabacteroides TaxID=2649774 RepID=UPI00247306B1|nr:MULTISPECIES: site-specific integrase [unclassified Parabacteroides]MDH6306369.1 site-specific recombinase XerD [Parabacteroides sp. PH5-39]MDH6314641.1 site-specific recombinase XerD [Parabacteroides sp. PF5-13]MDH6321080.1 site-specific recombinase XerD [Parabacteroides sp. PH5-13]MDH6324812.1 site-specific recombinase XerD [Parabacteroides sp. PH5-8]MDH6325507.1 site-specific recombinase XerD [Parabacteroides sp. PH5-41]
MVSLKGLIIQKWRKQYPSKMFFVFMQSKIVELKEKGKENTAKKYEVTLRCFSSFRKMKDVSMEQLTSKELKLFEEYLIRRGVVMNTISFYMRILRAVYNRAINESIIPPGNPFKQVYTGVAKTQKRAVDENVIRELQRITLKSTLAFARDLFLFSFYTRGMSFIDMANLKKKDVSNDIISYCRSKTGQQISIGLEPCMKEIIKRYVNETNETDFIFPILYKTGQQIKYETAIRSQNHRLKIISAQLKLSKALTTYTARHTWATIARNKGIPLPVISEGMGHTSEQTTRIYLASLNHTLIDQANRKIIGKTSKTKGVTTKALK